MKKRVEVKKHLIRNTKMGPVIFLKITYDDGSVRYGYSTPGMLALEPTREEAWKRANEAKVYGPFGTKAY
jgi:hypothetical protein